MNNKRGLGKGLGALFDLETPEEGQNLSEVNALEISLDLIDPNLQQARKKFAEEQMLELVESIKQHGVIQPILVRQNGSRYLIIAGERRYRAARKAGLSSIPAVVKIMQEQEYKEVSLIENLQRENLNALEEANGIKELMEEHGLTQDQIAQRLSKSRPYIANSLRLLSLCDKVKDYIADGSISAGHARALVVLPKDIQIKIAERIKVDELSVRQTEALIKSFQEPKKEAQEGKLLSTEMKDFQDKLMNVFGTRVVVAGDEKNGKIQINYYSAADLERIYEIIENIEQNQ